MLKRDAPTIKPGALVFYAGESRTVEAVDLDGGAPPYFHLSGVRRRVSYILCEKAPSETMPDCPHCGAQEATERHEIDGREFYRCGRCGSEWQEGDEDAIMSIVADEEVLPVNTVFSSGYHLPRLDVGAGRFLIVAEDLDAAREAAKKYWEDMVNQDLPQFLALLGIEKIVNTWITGSTFDDFIDSLADPDEVFGHNERAASDISFVSPALVDKLGFEPTICWED